MDENGKYKFNERHVDSAKLMLDALIFWAGVLKEARAKLSRD
jgi:hypothetical protein